MRSLPNNYPLQGYLNPHKALTAAGCEHCLGGQEANSDILENCGDVDVMQIIITNQLIPSMNRTCEFPSSHLLYHCQTRHDRELAHGCSLCRRHSVRPGLLESFLGFRFRCEGVKPQASIGAWEALVGEPGVDLRE